MYESTVGNSVAMGIGGSSSIADEVVVSGWDGKVGEMGWESGWDGEVGGMVKWVG